jgi:hypothetical protein
MGIPWRRMRRPSAVLAAAVIAVVALPVLSADAVEASVTVPSSFVWTANRASTFGYEALINNGATNTEPTDLLFVTPNLSPGGIYTTVFELYSLGVAYLPTTGKWAVVREDEGAMPLNVSFNILAVPKASSSVFVQRATASNTAGDSTFINSPLTNGKPTARIQVTADVDPGGSAPVVFSPHEVGVLYTSVRGQWAIFNEDKADMTSGAAFNVLVGQSATNGGKTQLVKVTKTNDTLTGVAVYNPETTGNPNNITLATQVWNPDGKGGAYNNHQPCVAYTGTLELVSNEGLSTLIPPKSGLNLLIFPG